MFIYNKKKIKRKIKIMECCKILKNRLLMIEEDENCSQLISDSNHSTTFNTNDLTDSTLLSLNLNSSSVATTTNNNILPQIINNNSKQSIFSLNAGVKGFI